jgi:hypothetical protein
MWQSIARLARLDCLDSQRFDKIIQACIVPAGSLSNLRAFDVSKQAAKTAAKRRSLLVIAVKVVSFFRGDAILGCKQYQRQVTCKTNQ